jgi:hypothetical protein
VRLKVPLAKGREVITTTHVLSYFFSASRG